MSGRDFSTEVDLNSGPYDDSTAWRREAQQRETLREAQRVSRSTAIWVYVIIFMLLFFIFIFVLLIYGKVKGFAVKPTMLTAPTALRKPGRTFTGTIGPSTSSDEGEED